MIWSIQSSLNRGNELYGLPYADKDPIYIKCFGGPSPLNYTDKLFLAQPIAYKFVEILLCI